MKPSTTDHPDRIQLTAFLDGRLSEDDRIVIERHVESCDDCCRAMAELPQDTLSGRLLEVDTDADQPSFAIEPPEPALANDTEIPAALRDHPRYRILGRLGQGGMGVVYKAEHRMMDREVALKVIDARFIENPQAIERFRTEVKAAARLTHANIVRAYDAEQADNLHFLVMEYVDGISLAELIRRNGPLPVQQVCGIIRKVAQGLHHAYEQGMVHRDIKPQNIMVTQDGRVRILDFGLARLAREREHPVVSEGENPQERMRRTADSLTMVGSVLGTPDYIAPEQAMDARQADTRADIYSLGCTCYFLLTGSPPYPTGSAMEKLISHVERTPTSIKELRSNVPDKIVAITMRMMERRPDDRYQTPREIAHTMDDFLKSGDSAAESSTLTDHGVAATLREIRSPFSEPDLLKVDLSAISIDGSETISTVELPAQTTGDTEPSQPAAQLPPSPATKVRTSARTSNRPGRSSRPAKKRFDANWAILVPALVVVTVIIGMALIPLADPPAETTQRRPDVAPAASSTPIANSSCATPVDDVSAGAWIDLLRDVNVSSNAPTGTWEFHDGELRVDAVEWARISLPCVVPDQYEFEVTFTRNTGVNSVALIFAMNGHQATLDIDAWGIYLAGIQRIDNQDCRTNETRVDGIRLLNGDRHTASVRVLRDRVEAYLDGQPLKHYFGDGSNLSLVPQWKLADVNDIGVGAYASATTFHQVRIRAIAE